MKLLVRLAEALKHGPSTTRDLSRLFGWNRDSVSACLNDLAAAGVVERAGKRGREVIWKLKA